MGIFRRTPQRVRIEDVDQLRDALDGLSGRLEEIEERDALVKLEVADWYEKFRALYARLNKRVQRETPEPAEPAAINPAALKILGGMK